MGAEELGLKQHDHTVACVLSLVALCTLLFCDVYNSGVQEKTLAQQVELLWTAKLSSVSSMQVLMPFSGNVVHVRSLVTRQSFGLVV